VHIIIDGYNLIRQSSRFGKYDRQDIQLGREALVEMLSAYKKKAAHRITVVFDGTGAPEFAYHRDKVQGIHITYSHQGETADTVILRLAAMKKEQVLVVSSDREIVHHAAASGAATISSPEFEMIMAEAVFFNGESTEGVESVGWVPSTQKKGPSRRLPKKERKNLQKIKKL
jgi:predicted RNA-binding protein with PIN domain